MKIKDITRKLEQLAPPVLQEHYDNAGLLTGDHDWECKGVLIALDCTEDVLEEAIMRNCNLVIAHHPVIFKGLKRITGKNYVERTIIKAIKHDIALYAIHTNLDNVIKGVSGKMASLLNLEHTRVLAPRTNSLMKLYTFVPVAQADEVRQALFNAGGGGIGDYDECSFNIEGTGTYRPGVGTNPFKGEKGQQHREPEVKIEVIFPFYLKHTLLQALKQAHPYEEVAFDIISLDNQQDFIGSGVIGDLPNAMDAAAFLTFLAQQFRLQVIRHTPLTGKTIQKVALCGGAGSFLINEAKKQGADVFITGDIKYHEFFDAEKELLIADIGHYESEQFTINLIGEFLESNFPNFAVLKTEVNTNPLRFFIHNQQ